MSDTWTIGELAEHAARALRGGAASANGRVRDVPGERLIRWYTTIGLVDPPLTRRGRIAQYGRRHLLQLVAVKRLQAAGHSIAQIQAALAGATDRMLEATAGLAPTSGSPDGPSPSGPGLATALEPSTTPRPAAAWSPDTTPRADGATWLEDALHGEAPPQHGLAATDHARPEAGATHDGPGAGADATHDGPAGDTRAAHDGAGARRDTAERRAAEPDAMWADDDVAQATTGTAQPPDGVARAGGEHVRRRFWADRPGQAAARAPRTAGLGAAHEGSAARVVTEVRLADGVRLVLDAGRVPSKEDVQAVLAAAAPLLAVLEERELTSTTTG
ncbi:MerR family transcriptional regulator [Nonomuraea sp. NPDC049695]|uniref:MerR family transcriptional regulator n=1 Tax=Nonomuraea sp. NPDC049695 TaxID=3154734 RepID=UPI00344268E6